MTPFQISETTPLRFVAPSVADWNAANISATVKEFWNSEWSKAEYEDSCSRDIIPVYYWPDERITLPCKMCFLAHTFNGKMKRWGYAKNVSTFLTDLRGKVSRGEDWITVADKVPNYALPKHRGFDNYVFTGINEFIGLDDGRGKNQRLGERLVQKDGKLTIFRADGATAGVYFCYDDDSRSATQLFYVLSMMAPPTWIEIDSYSKQSHYTDDCGNNKAIFPNLNWRFHWLPVARLDPRPGCSTHDEQTFCDNQWIWKNEAKSKTKFFNDKCNYEHCRLDLGNSLQLELRWDDWSSCENGEYSRRREGHCYLTRALGKRIVKDASKDQGLQFEKLNNVFDQKPFEEQGIRIHSSLFYNSVKRQLHLRYCYHEHMMNSGSDPVEFHKTWLDILEKMGLNPRNSATNEKLENPFQACVRYMYEDGRHYFVGTFATEMIKWLVLILASFIFRAASEDVSSPVNLTECPKISTNERFRYRLLKECPPDFDPICDNDSYYWPYGMQLYRCSIPLPSVPSPNHVTVLNTSSLLALLKHRDAYGRSWCMLAFFFENNCPFSAQLAEQLNELPKHSDILRVVAVNSYEFKRMSMRYGIAGTPTTILWLDGMGVFKIDGFPSKNKSLLDLVRARTDLSLYKNETRWREIEEEGSYPVFTVSMENYEYYEFLYFIISLGICVCSLLYILRNRIVQMDLVQKILVQLRPPAAEPRHDRNTQQVPPNPAQNIQPLLQENPENHENYEIQENQPQE
ncbi:hypothetical protein WR25_25276 [Diploscapter pachys]|uniref:Thioredoxin domain-containing protein n=1 Tax=Diploscapter pachys TaxID=2018661 RepID=A0A2A2LV44_9BILA|nr:hypothetical protein WR25_25276 [Diploscapter pachys]